MSDVFQGCQLLHKQHFESVKGRLATGVVRKTVTRAQWYLAKGGAVGWGFWDVKIALQNERERHNQRVREIEGRE